jgi:hypothetical protein
MALQGYIRSTTSLVDWGRGKVHSYLNPRVRAGAGRLAAGAGGTRSGGAGPQGRGGWIERPTIGGAMKRVSNAF